MGHDNPTENRAARPSLAHTLFPLAGRALRATFFFRGDQSLVPLVCSRHRPAEDTSRKKREAQRGRPSTEKRNRQSARLWRKEKKARRQHTRKLKKTKSEEKVGCLCNKKRRRCETGPFCFFENFFFRGRMPNLFSRAWGPDEEKIKREGGQSGVRGPHRALLVDGKKKNTTHKSDPPATNQRGSKVFFSAGARAASAPTLLRDGKEEREREREEKTKTGAQSDHLLPVLAHLVVPSWSPAGDRHRCRRRRRSNHRQA